MYRLTIRTFHGPVTEILKGLIVPQLGELVPQVLNIAVWFLRPVLS
jgi:hypothetical protein